MITCKLFGILCIFIATLTAQGGINYVNGPSFPIPGGWGFGSGDLDLDNDGIVDFNFWSSGMLCTMDIPTSGCGWPFYVRTSGTNEVLTVGSDASQRSLGERIGAQTPSEATWTVPGGFYGAGISYWWYSLQGREVGGQILHSGWSGGVGDAGVGYLGVRFYSSDGLHYGWIRARLPQSGFFFQPLSESSSLRPATSEPTSLPLELTPIVVDWAYETRPSAPIRAGDIGTDSDSVQFKVEFFDTGRKHHWPIHQSGSGSLILTDNKVRCELHLVGDFSTAEIRGPANSHSRGNQKPVWSFLPPLIKGANHTAFFGEATLTRAQLLQLARGQLYVSIDVGEVIGRISPVEDNKKP